MTMSKLKLGDVVMLKSGGPQMTIVGFKKSTIDTATTFIGSLRGAGIESVISARCKWFDADNKLGEATFNEDILIVPEDTPTGWWGAMWDKAEAGHE